jgi:hypothetical protein
VAGYGDRCPEIGPLGPESCPIVSAPDSVRFVTVWAEGGPTNVERSCPAGRDLEPPLPETISEPQDAVNE